MIGDPIAKRFWDKADKSGGPDACWPWLGAYNRPSPNFRRKHGAGESTRPIFWLGHACQYANRVALHLTDGVSLAARNGLEACHRVTCSNYRCVNPRHLYWGTPDQNRADRYQPQPAQAEVRA